MTRICSVPCVGGRASLIALVALMLLAQSARAIGAQGRAPSGSITGSVRDSSGAGIVAAEVTTATPGPRAESDARGDFRLTDVPSGPVSLRVRRLGFRPAAVDVAVEPGTTASVAVTLVPVAVELTPVVVRGTRRADTRSRTGFEERRRTGMGTYITREQIERRQPLLLTDVLRNQPGVGLSTSRLVRNAVRLRGARCAPLVWLDGAPLLSGEFDLDVLAPETIDGIEIYAGPASVPAQFMSARGADRCGVIVVWSGAGEPATRQRKVSTAELTDLVASLKVYTADQVDTPARLDSAKAPRPAYPDSLFGARATGRVVAEFVVDTVGRISMETFGVVSSTHALFTDAVRRALPDARFHPAMLGGRRVRQLVQLPFRFELAPAADARERPR